MADKSSLLEMLNQIEKGIDNLASRIPVWHDLKKNPKDLPPENVDVIIYSGKEWRMSIGRQIGGSWEAGTEPQIAWCEIPKYEVIE